MSDLLDSPLTEQIAQRTIFIIAENDALGELFKMILEDEPSYTPLLFSSPCEALRVARATTVDLFLIDFILPSITGIELYKRLRALPGLQQIPAIIASTNLERIEKELNELELIGLVEPFDIDDLMETVAQAFR